MDHVLKINQAPFCVIPAAGRSSRMGAWKPLLPWRGTTMCGAVVDTVLAAGLKPIVVAGYRADELSAAFAARPDVLVVVNRAWEDGMTGSIAFGATFTRGAPGFLVAPADMPLLPAGAFKLVLEAAARHADTTVFAARGSRLGHPVWIPASLATKLSELGPDSRLRDFLLKAAWISVQVDDEGIFADIDTPETYRAESLMTPGTRATMPE
jgi:molybdenum cofactor cytidylyltransferase